ncbi:MAG TPA: DUF3667 domain-containing protein [Rhizomicrobium sp.]
MSDDFGTIAELGGAAAIELVASALVDHGAHAAKCPNCGAPVIAAYCAVCGQERNTNRRSVRGLVGEFVREITSFDSRILRTSVALVVRPGELSLAFREGRTRRYVPALRLYLFVSLIFFLVLDATNVAIMQFELVTAPERIVTNANGQSFAIAGETGARIPISAKKAKEPGPHYNVSSRTHFFERIGSVRSSLPANARAKLADDMKRAGSTKADGGWGVWIKTHVGHDIDTLMVDPAAVNRPLTEWIPRVLFILLPLFALLLAVFYWRQRKQFYFVDHLVFSLNMHSFVFVAILVAVGLAQLWPKTLTWWLALSAIGLYLLLAMKRFYHQNWFWTGVKFATVSFIYSVFFLSPAVAAIVVLTLLNV